jgi:hypothetical protein
MIRPLALAFLLVGCSQFPEYDPGGDFLLALVHVSEAQEEVPIRGVCFSSCALKLAAPKVCVSPSAQIGVHEVRRASTPTGYNSGTRDEMATAFFEARLPACARRLFASLGGFKSGRLVTARGSELLAACPEIRPCG